MYMVPEPCLTLIIDVNSMGNQRIKNTLEVHYTKNRYIQMLRLSTKPAVRFPSLKWRAAHLAFSVPNPIFPLEAPCEEFIPFSGLFVVLVIPSF